MATFEHTLILIPFLAALSVIGRRLPWPMPVTYVLGAGLITLWPAFPHIKLNSETFFLCFVPPLLFAGGWLMPLREFMAAKRSILTRGTCGYAPNASVQKSRAPLRMRGSVRFPNLCNIPG